MKSRALCHLVPLLLSLVLAGCLKTTYHSLGAAGGPETDTPSFLERRVDYHLAEAFYATAPGCAAVMTRTAVPRPVARLVEDAVQRHLSVRLPRVIGAARLRRLEASLGLDMRAAGDRRVFARQTRCEALVEIRLSEVSDNYLVLWAHRGLTIDLTMRRIADGRLLWRARHRAGRADGGLPFTVVDLPISAARAAVLSSDAEMFASITDDAARRMIRTLPDIRDHGPAG